MKIRWFVLLIPSLVLGQGFTIEQVLSAPFPSDLVAAQRGQRVAWVFDAQGRRNIRAARPGPYGCACIFL